MASLLKSVDIIGGGLAGAEAASFLLSKGYEVTMYERRPLVNDGAHLSDKIGELVCSNSLKSKELSNACGLLKEELRRMNSICMRAAARAEVPSGNALSVDRDEFANYISQELLSNPHFHLIREEVKSFSSNLTIVATGPLTSGPLLDSLMEIIGKKNLSFFDASAPIVAMDSLDLNIIYRKSRFSQSDEAYLNAPFNREEYFTFVNELLKAEKALVHDFDTHYFEGCLPLEVIASRGLETLRHGPLKPFGLDIEGRERPYAVAQLRQDTKLGDYYNLVGFQTNLTYGEQKRVFSLIPGFKNAKFLRYGLMHRNSYIDAPGSLNEDLSLKAKPNLFIGGQLIGVEGYVESMMAGLIAGIEVYRKSEGLPPIKVPSSTVSGALLDYVKHSSSSYFAPMNANWALFPTSKKEKRDKTIASSLSAIESFWKSVNE
jgi:methylenetetrahydrofolate--tRNA-(uracil-5-)-methyltransferase